MLTQLTVGWLLLLAAVLTFVGGFGLRAVIGRCRDATIVRRVIRAMRGNIIGRVFFGPMFSDALDDDELDQMIVMPTIIVACALCLTAIFLLGWVVLT